MQGNTVTVFVNHVYLTSVTDDTYRRGTIGFGAVSQNEATEVAFNDIQVWQL